MANPTITLLTGTVPQPGNEVPLDAKVPGSVWGMEVAVVNQTAFCRRGIRFQGHPDHIQIIDLGVCLYIGKVDGLCPDDFYWFEPTLGAKNPIQHGSGAKSVYQFGPFELVGRLDASTHYTTLLP